MNEKLPVYHGLGILDVLTVVFIVLKLVGVVNWSWLWVLAPTLIPLGIILVVLFIVAIVLAIYKI